MIWFYNAVALLKKHGYSWQARFDIFGVIASIVLFILFREAQCLYLTFFFLTFLMWEVSDAENKEIRAELTRHLANKCDEVIILKGNLIKKNNEVEILKTTISNRKDNPIKSNRIVLDKTFAIRLLNVTNDIKTCDPLLEEELYYFKTAAERLLKWQTKTVRKDSEEYEYLERLGLIPKPSSNTEEHTGALQRENKPKRRTASMRKTKNTKNEDKD